MHRLHQVHSGLPGGCDSRRGQANAHGDCLRMHRLRSVRRALPGRLHRHAAGRWQPAKLALVATSAAWPTDRHRPRARRMSRVQLWEMPGGIHPAEHKSQTTGTPIQPAPLPKRLIVPLNQHIGAPAEPCVVVGERVLKGQLIAAANGMVSVPVHAPTSGIVSFIGPQPYPHVSGLLSEAIVIDSDGLEQWIELTPWADYRHLENSALIELIRQAGISGLGGAGFPTAVKLN